MQILSMVAKPSEKVLFPSLTLEMEIGRIRYGEAIVHVNGWLETDDGKTIACLVEETSDQPLEEEIGARGTSLDEGFKETTYKTVMRTLLDRRVLDHIELRSAADKRRCDTECKHKCRLYRQ